jgi:spore maturation protein CgeB
MKLKRLVFALVAVLALSVCAFGAAACFEDDLPDNSAGVTITLAVLDLDSTELFKKTQSTKKSSLDEVFKEFDGIQVDTTASSVLGSWLSYVELGTVVTDTEYPYFSAERRLPAADAENQYIAVYHDIDDAGLKDLPSYNLTVADKTYFYSNKGVSHLPLVNGATYILKLASY